MLAVSFDERKNVYRVNQLLKIFNAAESIKKEDPSVSFTQSTRKFIKNFKIFRTSSFQLISFRN